MSDMSSMNRETKKRQLRQQIVRTETSAASRDREEEARAAQQNARRRRRRIRLILLLFLVITGAGIYQYQRYHQYTGYQVRWETPVSEGSGPSYEKFGSNVLKYTKDGMTYIDNHGKTVWVQSYEMKEPVADVQGSYGAVADLRGNQIYICDTNGCTGTATTLLPITKISVAGNGVVAAVLEDSKSSYITYYTKEGTTLDISITDRMGSTGYPLDIALSPSGQQLMVSYVCVEEGEVRNRVVFYDFSEIGKNIPTRIVGAFDEFGASMIPRVRYLSDVYSCAFTDSGLTFFNSENRMSPSIEKQVAVEEEIQSVMYSEQYVGVIVKTNAGENPYRMEVYRINGDKVFDQEFDYQYRQADIDGKLVILYNEDSCRVYNMSGVEKLSTQLDMQVSKITAGSLPNTLILTGTQNMQEIKLQ